MLLFPSTITVVSKRSDEQRLTGLAVVCVPAEFLFNYFTVIKRPFHWATCSNVAVCRSTWTYVGTLAWILTVTKHPLRLRNYNKNAWNIMSRSNSKQRSLMN